MASNSHDRITPQFLQWLHNVITPEYTDPRRTYSDVIQALRVIPTLSPRTDVYTHENGRSQLLLCLYGTLPAKFRGAVYNIPVLLWIPYQYPLQPPITFVNPSRDMLIRPGNHVDGNGRCYHPYLSGWESYFDKSNIADLCDVLKGVFGREPPVYAKSAQQQQQQQQPPAPPPVPPLPAEFSSREGVAQTTPTPATAAQSAPPPTPGGTQVPPPKPPLPKELAPVPLPTPQPSQQASPVPPPPPPKPVQAPAQQHEHSRSSSLPGGARAQTASPPPLPPAPHRAQHSHTQTPPPAPAGAVTGPAPPPVPPVPPRPSSVPYTSHYAQPPSISAPPRAQGHGGAYQQRPVSMQYHPPPSTTSPPSARYALDALGGPPPPPLPSTSPRQSPLPPPPPAPHPVSRPQSYIGPNTQLHIPSPLQPAPPPPPVPPPPVPPPPVPPQSHAPSPPTQPKPKPPIPDLMDAPDTDLLLPAPTATLPGTSPIPPPLPPNPQKDHLISTISSHLHTLALAHHTKSTTALTHASAQHSALLRAQSALAQEQTDLLRLLELADSNMSILTERISAADSLIRDVAPVSTTITTTTTTTTPKYPLPDIDKVVCVPTVVLNQLYDLVTEDMAIEDTIYVLGKALDREKVGLEQFLKHVRMLAREQFLLRATVRKIVKGVGLEEG
ncbi:UEV domain-containing protein [Kalaharituber pfeilii]|nr:UEV domain-containing protein [Kalaharituber pfeilii]